MDTKKCNKCQQELVIKQFSSSRARFCKDCQRNKQLAYLREWQRVNQERYKKSKKELAKRRAIEIKEILRQEKSRPCTDCRKTYDPYVMDFDHRPNEKKRFKISGVIYHSRSLKTILAEIAKCDVVCANCHRDRTYKRYNPPDTRPSRTCRLKLKEKLWKAKDRPCEICNIQYNPWQMDFDHLTREEKADNIGELFLRNFHIEERVLFNEIAKCRVLCANCHRLHTKQQLQKS